MILLLLIITGCEDLFDLNFNNPKELWGEWLRMDTGDKWYISGRSIKVNRNKNPGKIKLSKQSDRVIEVTEGGRKYYLYSSRTANASYTGNIADLDDYTSSAGRSVGGLNGINIVINSLNNAMDTQTVTTDANGKFTVNGAIPGDTYQLKVEKQTVTFTPTGNGDDMGTITRTDGTNFKARIEPTTKGTNSFYSGSKNNINYKYPFNIIIENTGTKDCLAATYECTYDDSLSVTNAKGVLQTIEPKKSKTINIEVSCKDISTEYAFKKIWITIKDNISKKTWKDAVSIQFYKAPVEFYVGAERKIGGVIIHPNGKAYCFERDDFILDKFCLTIPYSAGDYFAVFSGATADTEAIYSLGIQRSPYMTFPNFTNLGIYEPNDTEETAAVVKVNLLIAYLHKNDIDYYKFNLQDLNINP